MWTLSRKENSGVGGFSSMRLPVFPDMRPSRLTFWNHVQLFGIAWICVISSFSITLAVFLLKRLNFGLASPIRIFVSYVSGVRLYTQSHRGGGGTLDGIREPPRFTMRRRMVRALVDVATADYDRWYVLAHSLGTVVAFNGLMIHAHSIPNYLDERRWHRLRRRADWIGPPRERKNESIDNKIEIPPRPLWISDPDVVVYRDKLFSKFRGFFTYGSPLDKFAGMWPAYVPINPADAVFPPRAQWINIFDRTDPVAASLQAYNNAEIRPANYGYKASPALLVSHLKYLDLHRSPGRIGKEPADLVVDWLLLDRFEPPRVLAKDSNSGEPLLDGSSGWYHAGSWTARLRVISAYFQWFDIAVLLTYLGVWVLRYMLYLGSIRLEFKDSRFWWLLGFFDLSSVCKTGCNGMLGTLWQVFPSLFDAIGLALVGAACTIATGAIGWLSRKDDNDPRH
jgi:hypothetical protein